MNKKEVLKERKLKVYQQSRENNYNVPTIILKGVWLNEFGFNIHNDVNFTIVSTILSNLVLAIFFGESTLKGLL